MFLEKMALVEMTCFGFSCSESERELCFYLMAIILQLVLL